jgi:hypothetical protein
MTDYQRCPFCAGHEQVSAEAASLLGDGISDWVYMEEGPLKTELANIHNRILNDAQRAVEIDPLLS